MNDDRRDRAWMSGILMVGCCLVVGCLDPSDTDETSQTESKSSEPEITPLDCQVVDAPYEVPVMLEANTAMETDDFSSSCSKGETSGDADVA